MFYLATLPPNYIRFRQGEVRNEGEIVNDSQ